MIQHLFKLAVRHSIRNKSAFCINLASLTIGLTGLLFILFWMKDELSIDKFHPKDKRLFQVLIQRNIDDQVATNDFTQGPLAATLMEELPEIEYATNIIHWFEYFNISTNEETFSIKGYYVGKAFFNVFGFKLQAGTPDEVLNDPNSVAISERIAIQFFDTAEGALGQTITLENGDALRVSGVFQDVPEQSTLQFDLLMSYDKFIQDQRNAHRNTWELTGPFTMLTLKEGADVQAVTDKINVLVQSKYEEPIDFKVHLQAFSDRYLYAKYEQGKVVGGRIDYVRLFGLIGLFLMLMSCVNFMNLSTAQAFKRMKEVGIKKTLGIKKRNLVFQYLIESTILASVSILLALLAVELFLPAFNQFTDKNIQIQFNFQTVTLLLGLAGFAGLLAGSYPAFYLSSFQPLKTLKGIFTPARGVIGARRILVVFQFSIAIFMMIGVLVVYRQIEFVQTKNLGYDKENLVQFVLNIPKREQINTFLEAAKKIPGVANISSGNTPVNHQNRRADISWPGKNPADEPVFYFYKACLGLPETMGLQLKAGRTFSAAYGLETNKVLVNETAVKRMGLEQAVGQTINMGPDQPLEIIGVVKDFHFQALHAPIEPLLITFMEQASPQLLARLERGKSREALAGLQALYQQFNPGVAFSYAYIDQQQNALYATEQKISALSRLFTGFTLLICGLGLFGLVLYLAERRKSEIGIRKVLGATTAAIVRLLSKEFLLLILLSLLIASPFAWYFMEKWLTGFAYRIELSWWMFALAGLSAVGIAFFTAGFQSVKAALANPADSLRSE